MVYTEVATQAQATDHKIYIKGSGTNFSQEGSAINFNKYFNIYILS